MRRLALSLMCGVAIAGCRVFTEPPTQAPPPPAPPPVIAQVVPTAAFAGQTVRLELSGRTLDLGKVTVHLGQSVADAQVTPDGALQVTVPRLDGACQSELVLEADSPEAPIPAVTLTYLGAGHPGAPRLSKVQDQHLAFVPRQLVAGSLGSLAATAFGPLQVNLDDHGLVSSTEALEDFPALLVHAPAPTCTASDALVRVGQSGSLKLSTTDDIALQCAIPNCPGGCPPVTTDYEAALPSAITSDDSSMAGQIGSFGETIGLLLTGDGGVAAFDDPGDGGVSSTALPASAVSQFVAGARGRVERAYSDATPWVVIRDGAAPALLASDAQGQEVASRALSTRGPARLLASSSGGDFQRFSTTTTGIVAMAWQVTPQGTSEPCDASDPACAAQLPVGYSLQVAQLGHDDTGSHFDWVSPPLAEAVALSDLAVDDDAQNATVHIFAIARNEPYLRHYTWQPPTFPDAGASDVQAPVLVETVPMGAVGRRLVFTPKPKPIWGRPTRISVADEDGAVHLFDFTPGQPLTQAQVEPIPVGLAALSPEVGQSCTAPSVLAGAAQLGSVVVAPTRDGASPAFFDAPTGAQAVLGVTVTSTDGEHALLYLVSGGLTGFSVAPSLAQAQAQGISPQAQTYIMGATSMAQVPAADGAYLVVGGPNGLGAVHLRYGMPASDTAIEPDALYNQCGAVRQVVAVGDHALALGTTSGSQAVLCTVDPATGAVKQGVGFDPGYTRFALASAAQHDPQAPAAAWVVLAGQAGSTLMLASVDPARLQVAPQPIPISEALASLVLPQDSSPLSSLALSPDGHRLLLGFAGAAPGLVALDPLQLLDPSATDGDRISQSGTTLLSGAPTAIAFTQDGALALVAQDDDHLAGFR